MIDGWKNKAEQRKGKIFFINVFPEEETEEIDVDKEGEELRRLEKDLIVIEEKIEGYLKELDKV